MEQYVGLDVSLKETSVCVFDQAGKIVWQERCASTPEASERTVRERAPKAVRVGLNGPAGDLAGLPTTRERLAADLPGCAPCQSGAVHAGQQDRQQRCPGACT